MHFAIRYPEQTPRWLNLLRVLGLIGAIALPFSGDWRMETGRQKLRLADGSVVVGQVDERQNYGELYGYDIAAASIDGAETNLVQLYDDQVPLYAEARQNSERLEEVALQRNQLVYVRESQGAWKRVETLQGDEGWIVARSGADLSKTNGGRLLLRAVDVKDASPEYKYHLAALIAAPFALLAIANVVWLPLLPALFLFSFYRLAGWIIMILNWLHALVLERQNVELLNYLARADLLWTKMLYALSGLADYTPHIDIYASERNRPPFRLHYDAPPASPRWHTLLRIGLPVLAVYAAWKLGDLLSLWISDSTAMLIVGGLLGLIPALSMVSWLFCNLAIWVYSAITGKTLRFAADWIFRLARLGLTLSALWSGLSAAPAALKNGLASPAREAAGEAEEDGIDPQAATRIDLSLVALWILLPITGGLYFFCWLARTAKLMGDDVYAILLTAGMGFSLPLCYYMPRYYRRSEMLTKSPPSWIAELLMTVPGLNLLLGPIVIQYNVNYYARLRARGGG